VRFHGGLSRGLSRNCKGRLTSSSPGQNMVPSPSKRCDSTSISGRAGRTLYHREGAGPRRNGDGLPRSRPEARSQRSREGPQRRHSCVTWNRAIPPGDQDSSESHASTYRARPRLRRDGWRPLLRDAAHRWRDTTRQNKSG